MFILIVLTHLLAQAELKHIPIPAIEGKVDNYEYKFDGMRLYGYDLLPDHIHVKVINDARMTIFSFFFFFVFFFFARVFALSKKKN